MSHWRKGGRHDSAGYTLNHAPTQDNKPKLSVQRHLAQPAQNRDISATVLLSVIAADGMVALAKADT